MSDQSRAAAGGRTASARRAGAAGSILWLVLLGATVLAAVLALAWAKFAYNSYLSLLSPAQVDYGEGIVWQQALLIPGPRMYADLQQYPFLVFHYPPFYHLVVRAVAMAGVPWLVAGRLVSMASAAALAVLAGALVLEATRATAPRRAAVAGAILAALLFATFQPIQFWARTMRVDMLAIALEFLGMYLGLLALRRPRLLYAAALVFVLAAYTKQTALGGAIATFAVLLPRMAGRVIRAGLLATVAASVAFAALTVATDGGFPQHVILYNANRFSVAAILPTLRQIGTLAEYPAYILAATAIAAVVLGRLARRAPVAPGPVMFALYFLVASADLVALGKSGAWSNYLIPWVSSWALLIGWAATEAGKALVERPVRPVLAAALLALLVPQVIAAPSPSGERRLVDPEFRRQYAELLGMVERAAKPVFSDDMVLLIEAGREVPWEPAIITELTSKGLFDERKVVALIDAHAFAFMVVGGRPGERWYDARYSPAVSAAIERNYPEVRSLAETTVRLPWGEGSGLSQHGTRP